MNHHPTPEKQRFLSIDILRGAAMLIMALGHVRHFLHYTALTDEPTNLATTTPALFFTRWISHYCAATFIFLSGISIFITGQKKTKEAHSSFLIRRGLWLVIVELFIITFGLTFNPAYQVFILQVIWATGWSMVIVGLLLRTSYSFMLITGCILFFGHNLLDYAQLPEKGVAGIFWKLLFTTHGDNVSLSSGRSAWLLYAILPWTGVMLLGYAFGALYEKTIDAVRRKKILILSGTGFIALFILLRIINRYGDPAPWSVQKSTLFTILSFLNVSKYPVSLQYGCMTLGPVLLLLAATEPWRGGVPTFLSMFGKVPLFYYVLHFFLIHIIVGVLFFVTGHTWMEALAANSPFLFRPLDFGFSLKVVYVIWIAVVLMLYRPCCWFVQYKQVNKQWWMRYL